MNRQDTPSLNVLSRLPSGDSGFEVPPEKLLSELEVELVRRRLKGVIFQFVPGAWLLFGIFG